jgi:hypothetical protein
MNTAPIAGVFTTLSVRPAGRRYSKPTLEIAQQFGEGKINPPSNSQYGTLSRAFLVISSKNRAKTAFERQDFSTDSGFLVTNRSY